MQPLITIITVVYNHAAGIQKTIDEVAKLNYSNYKYIVIDGGSTDGTIDVLKKNADKIYTWISEPDKGIYDAMNKGWQLADDNSYIIFLGAGDYIKQLPDMAKHINDDIIYGKVEMGQRYVFDTTVDFRMKLANAAHHQALLIKKSIHPQPPFLLQFPVYADFDFNQRLYKAGNKFIKNPDFLSYMAPGGVSSNEQRKELSKIVRKNFGSTYFFVAKAYYLFQDVKKKLTGFPSD